MRREIPQQWHNAMERVGATDPRNGKPSMRRLADLAGTTPTTISAMMFGTRGTDAHIVQQVAKTLRVGIHTIYEWMGEESGPDVGTPYEPPAAANKLTIRQRNALDEIIMAMVDPQPMHYRKQRNELVQGRNHLTAVQDTDETPDVSQLAASKGTSEGRRRRAEQDAAGEEPQDT